jgi:hypothetical protein
VVLDDLDHVGWRRLFEQRRSRPEPQGKTRKPAKPEGERQRWRADEHILGRDAKHFLRIAIGDDQHVAVEMHRCLGHSGGAGGEPQERHVVATGFYRLEAHGLGQSQPVKLGIVIGCAVEIHHLVEERLSLAQAPFRPSALCRTAPV